MVDKQISLVLNSQLLFELDRYILEQLNKNQKNHVTRQRVISDAIIYYLKMHCGIPFMIAMSKEEHGKN
jgi:metal-responsive CopG/Arc/MetJ family transcriptional regulator